MVKRVSAVGTVPNKPVRRRTVGMDVDSELVVVAFLDVDADEVRIDEYPNNPAGLQAMVRACQAHKPEICILESTGQYSLAVYDSFDKSGLFVVVINPVSIKALLRADGAKTDRYDAVTLARCGALFPRLQWSNMPDRWQREVRLHLRLHDDAQMERTRLSNRLAAQLRQAGLDITKLGGPNSVSRWSMVRALQATGNGQVALLHPQARMRVRLLPLLEPVVLSDALLHYRDSVVSLIERCDGSIAEEREWLLAQLDDPVTEAAAFWMRTVPCTSDITTMRCLAEFGRNFTERYPKASAFCAANGTAPRTEITGGRVVALAATPGRKSFLSGFTSELKGYMLHLPLPLRQWLMAYKLRGASFSRQLLTLGHHITESWYFCTKLQVPYDPVIAVGHREGVNVKPVVDDKTGEVQYVHGGNE